MTTRIKGIFVVHGPSELEAEICRYNCHSKEELEDVLLREYGVILKIKE